MKILSQIVLVAIAIISIGLASANSAFAQSGQRSVAVLSDIPQPLTLTTHNGKTWLMDFEPRWEQTSRGYETTIEFPVSFVYQHPSLMLIGGIGDRWSRWHPTPHMTFLRHSNVGPHDPACVGGKRWCAVRGL
ncbi:MAG: hypothetical protein WD605_00190 [Candidatus Paceibacterota bacterium]